MAIVLCSVYVHRTAAVAVYSTCARERGEVFLCVTFVRPGPASARRRPAETDNEPENRRAVLRLLHHGLTDCDCGWRGGKRLCEIPFVDVDAAAVEVVAAAAARGEREREREREERESGCCGLHNNNAAIRATIMNRVSLGTTERERKEIFAEARQTKKRVTHTRRQSCTSLSECTLLHYTHKRCCCCSLSYFYITSFSTCTTSTSQPRL